MIPDDIAIRTTDVSKRYLVFNRPSDRLKQSIVPRAQRLLGREPSCYYREFAALDSVSVEIRRGETVGIVGRNGSGKSTLLQIICGTLQPTAGTVQVNGRIAALLELGAGFDPEFTGRENVYLNASIQGLSRAETDARFDDIAAFADIGEHIEQPVKTYSSGMYVRLAFAAAINIDPDILIVDEALAVGDEAFQRKCFSRIEAIKEKGGTILFVSHGPQTIVQLCSRAFLLDRGELILQGRPKMVVGHYQRLVNAPAADAPRVRAQIVDIAHVGEQVTTEAAAEPSNSAAPAPAPAPSPGGETMVDWHDAGLVPQTTVVYDPTGARIEAAHVTTTSGKTVNNLQPGREYVLRYRVTYDEPALNAGFGVMFKTHTGLALAGMRTGHLRAYHVPSVGAGESLDVAIRFRCAFVSGVYFITLNASGERDGERVFLHRIVDALAIRIQPMESTTAVGYFDLDASIRTTRAGAVGAGG